MEPIVRLAELDRTDTPIAGGKDGSLGELVSEGFPAPPGSVVTARGSAGCGTMTIVTVTLNPAVDVCTSVPRIEPERKLHCTAL
jgi:hypothetical protein